MLRFATWLSAAIIFLLAGCKHPWSTEKEEASYWDSYIMKPASEALYHDKNPVRALHIYDSTLNEAPIETPFIKAARHSLTANYHFFFTADTVATEKAIDSALAYFVKPAEQKRYPRAYLGYLLFGGEIANRQGKYSKANDYYFKAKRTADAYLDPCERSAFSYNIAMVLYRQENFRQSADYFKEAYATQATCPVQTTAIILQQQEIQSNIGLCLLHLGRADSAKGYFLKSLEIADNFKDSLGAVTVDKIRGVAYGNLARVYLAANKPDEAAELFSRSIKLNARPGYELTDAVKVQLHLAELKGKQQKIAEMKQLLIDARAGLDTLPSKDGEAEWHRIMVDYYSRANEPLEELRFLKRYQTLHDSLDALQTRLVQADVTRQLKDKEQEMQIAVLKKDNLIAYISLFVAITVVVMAAVIITLVYQNYKKSRKSLDIQTALNAKISKQKAALEEETARRQKLVTEAVIRAQEAERSLIGLELHDNINQVLTTVKLHTEMVLDGLGDPKDILPRSSQYLQSCINEIRSLSKRLSAPTLGKISLEESVKDLVDSINLTNKVKIEYSFHGLEKAQVSQELHLAFYRIIQEQLNNVLKYAEASSVNIELHQQDPSWALSITDNGKGFDVSRKRDGIGIMNMQTRAGNLGGSLKLISAPGRGCKLLVTIPAN